MPRKPRIDAPGALYHIIARGIEQREIFRDDNDRNFFLSRAGEILSETDTHGYAFALIPNHFHLLLRRAKTPISTVMRRLLTGYAIYFNRRHGRVGHLFQNRYKAIICQEATYLLELIRYIHLNPVRAGLAKNMEELNKYSFAGHSLIVSGKQNGWFDPDVVLSHFGSTKKKALDTYLEYVSDGFSMGKRKDLSGGGLKRSLGFPKNYPQEKMACDDRILGDGGFVKTLIKVLDEDLLESKNDELDKLFAAVCSEYQVSKAELLGGAKKRNIAKARAILAYRMSKEIGLSDSNIAKELSSSQSAVFKMIKKEQSARVDG